MFIKTTYIKINKKYYLYTSLIYIKKSLYVYQHNLSTLKTKILSIGTKVH